jgi:hypothetical protein
MKHYTLSGADSITHTPEHPERTSRRNAGGGMNFDVVYQVWPNRPSMARTIRMQEKRERQPMDWRPVVALSPGEGF